MCVSSTQYESSCVIADEPSVSMAKSNGSDADLLLAFESISVSEQLRQKDGVASDCIENSAFDPIDEGFHSEQRRENFEDTCKYNSFDLSGVAESSGQRDGAGEVILGVDQHCKLNPPLIVYTSSRRSAFNTELNCNNETGKTLKCKRMAGQNSVVNLDDSQMFRKSRNSVSKDAQSSVWVPTTLPDSEVNSRTDLNLANEKPLPKGSKGKSNSLQGQESFGKQTPTGRISLKIKIGNQICGRGNAAENFTPRGKDVPELHDTMKNELGEEVPEDLLPRCERSLEKVMASEAFGLSAHLNDRSSLDEQSFNASRDFHRIPNLEDSHNLGAANMCSDVGTSPDSEVINSVPDAPLVEKGLPDLQGSQIMSKVCISPNDTSDLILPPKKAKKGSKKDNLHQVSKCTLKIKLPGSESSNTSRVLVSKGDVMSLNIPETKSKRRKKKNKLHEVGDSNLRIKQTATETRNVATAPPDYGVSGKTADDANETSRNDSNRAETTLCPEPVATFVSSNSKVRNRSTSCGNGLNFSKHSRKKGGSKGMSGSIDFPNRKDKNSTRKGKKINVSNKYQTNENAGANGVIREVQSCLDAGNQAPPDLGENGARKFSSRRLRNAWVLCDECHKWRRIPATLADHIEETNCGWSCKENTDTDFADCSIPQEMTNSEINEELELSEASCEEDSGGTFRKINQNQPKVPQQASWSLIKSNFFLHRTRKTQTIDEVMVCHCKPPPDGKMGCGAKCLNRMLNIECVQGTCPCGDLCSNQQFQKRKYAKLKWFRCGKKGYGLQALEDISQGQFLIEYVGEVLDVHAYEARQREYALNGHRHFYFMTLNGSEVIDACAKGNLARFINHSCNPNCRTEKWMVNGEVCVGLFALRNIKKGEEVTFDYNYVRVFGAAAKKCVCGSANCRGYIGGDPTSSEIIVQDDSDDEFSEPVMTCGDKELNEDWRDIMLNSSKVGENENANEPKDNISMAKKLISTAGEDIMESQAPEPLAQVVEDVYSAQVQNDVVRDEFEVGNYSVEQLATDKVNGESMRGTKSTDFKVDSEGLQSQVHGSSQFMEMSVLTDGISDTETFSVLGSAVAAASPGKSLSDTVEPKRKLKHAAVGGELATSNSLTKIKSSSSVRKRKPKNNAISPKRMPDTDKLNATLNKSKKLPGLNMNSHFEAVEETLNELLDPDGGISKRKDASRGYLKLLFLTAASGNNGHGEAIQSNRDLSMILDALLKTKSRTVLIDIINKNGLQMLHNIMKRYRKDFNKTPILRKLLKVLEHLALREILTLEHITGGPPCVGVESFKDSMLVLTEHADRQVHQIARNFRDRWIPRSLRKNYCMERDSGRSEFNCHSSYGDSSISNDKAGDKTVKPSDFICSNEKQALAASGATEVSAPSVSGGSCGNNRVNSLKRKSRWDIPVGEYSHSRIRTCIEEDAPPGFSSPCNGRVVQSDASSNAIRHCEVHMDLKKHPHDVILGDAQPRFAARIAVSYGVPSSIMQKVGARHETSEGWAVAPAVPFHPFPPLPPFSYEEGARKSSAATCPPTGEYTEKTVEHCKRTCRSNPLDSNLPALDRLPDLRQGVSCSLGRKYFRQQKWNHSKLTPPWIRMKNGRSYNGNNTGNDSPGASDFRHAYNSQEVSWQEN
ncbi:histone-lysine N-methyltransferase ASHH2-like isoform X2 [Andrographis paniculata]|nr:histone-lysine N-methyltransferase ASHH2-like isoform X2 [Andrographis paniculata]